MENPSLTEVVKEYVYTRRSLAEKPEDPRLLLRMAELCVTAGLYRMAYETATRALSVDPSLKHAHSIGDSARSVLEGSAGKYCVIAVERSGCIVTADRMTNVVTKLTSKGETKWVYEREGFEDEGLYHPDCLAVDPVGNAYVGSSVLSRVQVLSNEGRFERVFPVPKHFGTRVRMESLACDEAGDLWIMDSESGVLRLVNPDGEELRIVRIGA